MNRKIVSCVLLASVSFYIGCYSTTSLSRDELRARVEPVDITVVTKDSLEYKFLRANYRIQGDTLTGAGVRNQHTSSDIVLDARLSFESIASIETSELDIAKTIGLCGGIGLAVLIVIAINSRPSEAATIAFTPN